jgi:hypothetical protein
VTRTIATVALAAAVLTLPAGPAGAEPSPTPGGVDCRLEVRKSYRLQASAKHGLPVKVSCDGPASFRSGVDFTGKADETFNTHGTVGLEGGSDVGSLGAAGTATIRVRLARYAIRRARELKVSRLLFLVVVEREDGSFVSIPSENKRSKLVNPSPTPRAARAAS